MKQLFFLALFLVQSFFVKTSSLPPPSPKLTFLSGQPHCHSSGSLLPPPNLAGAVYFMTNDPNGNLLVVSALHSDGSLNFSHTLSTGGLGGYEHRGGLDVGQISIDALLSQDSILVQDLYLFVVNAGSSSLSMFLINPFNPLRLILVDKHDSGGDFPVSVSYSSTLKWACVLNGGARCGVQCFFVSPLGLVPLLQTNKALSAFVSQTTPPHGPNGTFSDIIFSQDDSFLIVSIKGDDSLDFQGFVATFKINILTLSLSDPIINYPQGIGFFSVSNIPGTKLVLFADVTFGYGILDFNTGGGVKDSSISTIPGQRATCWTACSSKSNHCFTIDGFTGVVTELGFPSVGCGPPTGQVLKQYQTPGFALDTRLASVDGVEYLYLISPSTDPTRHGVSVLTVSGSGAGTARIYYFNETIPQECGVTLNIAIQGMGVFIKWL